MKLKEKPEEMNVSMHSMNVIYIAQRKLRVLQHTTSIREYMKQFFGQDMVEINNLFYFLVDLQPKAYELHQRNVMDLALVQATVEWLINSYHLRENER